LGHVVLFYSAQLYNKIYNPECAENLGKYFAVVFLGMGVEEVIDIQIGDSLQETQIYIHKYESSTGKDQSIIFVLTDPTFLDRILSLQRSGALTK
jgi:hypothetical protein